VDHLTVPELKKIWEPGSKVKKWSDVRPSWPARDIHLYGAGHDSGTFDYFTETINGKSQACREDFTASEDDNVLVQGIAGDKDALGFFGFAYYLENKDKLKIVPIDGGKGPVTPSDQTIENGSYAPLSRPIFIYVRKSAAKRPEVDAFVKFYITNAPSLVKEVGYTPLPKKVYDLALARYTKRTAGSAYKNPAAVVGKSLEQIFAQ
jgi:phosphate transport system substrate-binding protein